MGSACFTEDRADKANEVHGDACVPQEETDLPCNNEPVIPTESPKLKDDAKKDGNGDDKGETVAERDEQHKAEEEVATPAPAATNVEPEAEKQAMEEVELAAKPADDDAKREEEENRLREEAELAAKREEEEAEALRKKEIRAKKLEARRKSKEKQEEERKLAAENRKKREEERDRQKQAEEEERQRSIENAKKKAAEQAMQRKKEQEEQQKSGGDQDDTDQFQKKQNRGNSNSGVRTSTRAPLSFSRKARTSVRKAT